ncbi:AraC family transcriptional regulator [Vallitalea pronyensis]|uniref:AraC family transcriptional regulator n=1 Tax=Vallitalea pronyensis TaxID=1348613 RepID=A0A8J8SEV8_9FIRM|nr:AraC family transcriptional regulator [Vallitalea pronyensis]QUI20950.1 AraC family transcriptional regulator [Vallitalea pronyensis]
MKSLHIDDNEMNPTIRKVGIQGISGWPKGRKLYDYEMLYVIKGKGNIEVNGQRSKLTSGSLVLIPPDTASELSFTSVFIDVIWIHFDFMFFGSGEDIDDFDSQLKKKHLVRPQIYFHNGYTLPYHMKVDDKQQFCDYFKRLLDHYSAHGLFWQLRCKSILLEILYQMVNQLYLDSGFSDSLSKERLVHDMQHYIHTHYTQKLTLSEIAGFAGISHNYANQLFKDQIGETIIQHLNQFRIKKAINLIKTSSLTMEQIAEQVGFSNTYYFSRVMKKTTGNSPTDYKKGAL